MQDLHFLGKISLRAIIAHQDNVLIVRDVGDATTWEIPGGRLHEGETLEQGMDREIFEELGVHLPIGKMLYSEQFHQSRDGSLHLMLTFLVPVDDPNIAFTLDPHEVAETKWIRSIELSNYTLYDNCLHALQVYWTK